tara:strand:- start:630 stop:938 length:309 start_codon:yes stop_codon:yes gene_type:complete
MTELYNIGHSYLYTDEDLTPLLEAVETPLETPVEEYISNQPIEEEVCPPKRKGNIFDKMFDGKVVPSIIKNKYSKTQTNKTTPFTLGSIHQSTLIKRRNSKM